MAKINRISGDFKAFGSAAVGTERTVFGGVTQSDIIDDNITANFLRGWGIVGVNENPTKQDFNALGFTLSQVLAYLHQQGVASWDTLQEYNVDAITTKSGVIYISQSDANIGNDPATDSGANWLSVTERQQSTTAQAIAGTDTTTDMSPAAVKQAILALGAMAGASPEVAAGRTNSVKRADGTWSVRVRHLPQDYALQTWADDLALGAYDVHLTVAQNGLPSGWWYIEVMRSSSDNVNNQYRYLRATPLDAPLSAKPVYHCSVVNGTWSAWTPVSDNLLTWYTPTFVNSWADYTLGFDARYAKDLTNGIVYMKGLVKGGSSTTDTTIFTLPVGMRPSTDIVISQTISGGSGAIKVLSTGAVLFMGANINTGNATAWLSINTTFKGEI